ncbi:MAG TPA: heparinase, partial [Flavobacterium sp.]|nr:heparinase [Flavobacterium sp.]
SLELKFGITSFTNSGYYLFRTNSSFTFVKCSNYKDRPAQSDNLHIDIWHNGENVIRDSGSYKYNTDEENSNYFFGTKSHNTVMIENHNQMLKGGRFIWYYWPKNALVTVNENEDEFIFNGAVNVFSFIDKKCKHTRKITISKTHPNWIIEDTLTNSKNKKCYQIWNCNPNIPIDFEAVANSQIVIANEYSSFYSSLYGQKEEQKGYSFEFDSTIKTEIKLLNSFCK